MADGGSFIGASSPNNGSFVYPGTLIPTISEIRWTVITTPPTDTPAVGTERRYINESGAAPYRRLYTYSDSGWSYAEV